MVHTLLLGVHVAAGTAGLLLGPIALAVRTRASWHSRLGVAYQGAVAATTSTALGLVALAPGRLAGLGLIAAATEGAALADWQVRRRHARGWVVRHIRLMCGSYLSLVTAALVVNWASPLAWMLPTVIGAPLINRAVKHATQLNPPPARTVRI